MRSTMRSLDKQLVELNNEVKAWTREMTLAASNVNAAVSIYLSLREVIVPKKPSTDGILDSIQ